MWWMTRRPYVSDRDLRLQLKAVSSYPLLRAEVLQRARHGPGHTPIHPLHPLYTPPTPLTHPLYIPYTSPIHPPYTPHTPPIHPRYTPYSKWTRPGACPLVPSSPQPVSLLMVYPCTTCTQSEINLLVQDPGAREAGNGMTFLMLLDEAAERARYLPGPEGDAWDCEWWDLGKTAGEEGNQPWGEAWAYTRPLLSSTRVDSDTKVHRAHPLLPTKTP